MLYPDAFHLIDAYIIAAAVVEAGRFVVGASGHALRDFQSTAVLQVIGEAASSADINLEG